MAKITLEKFCCCFSLKTGSSIIALLGLLCNAALFFLGVVAAFNGNFDDSKIFGPQHCGQIYVDKHLHAKLLIPFAAISACFDMSLLLGVIKAIHKDILPWLILQGSALVATLYLVLSLLFAYPVFILGFFVMPFWAYIWTVVFSYYHELKESDKNGAPNTVTGSS